MTGCLFLCELLLCVLCAWHKHDMAVPAGSEVCGEAGSGKTQLLLQVLPPACSWSASRALRERVSVWVGSHATRAFCRKQLLVRSQMSTQHGGLGRKAVYICTEGEPPTTRLFQIAQEHVAAFPDAFERGHPLDHIMIEKVCSDGASWKSRQRECIPNVACA